MTKIVCWNIAKKQAPWRELVKMADAGDADVALLQEAGNPPWDIEKDVDTGPSESWDSRVWNADYEKLWGKEKLIKRFGIRGLFDRWCKIVKLSNHVEIEWFKQISPIAGVARDEIAVSGIGTIAAARIIPPDSDPFIVISMYARWLGSHPSAKGRSSFPDSAAHRIISDLTAFIGTPDPGNHRILAAGDLNMVYGVIKGNGKPSMTARERGVWERMDALGLEFIGPNCPNGRQAHTTPDYLPPDTLNVPTYHSNQKPPESAVDQLDYAFASRGFHNEVRVRAMNEVDEWGPSDHCRLLIEVGAPGSTE